MRSLGADEVVRRGDGVAARIRKLVPDGVDALFDSALQGEVLLSAVSDGSLYAAGRTYAGGTERGIIVRSVVVLEYAEQGAKLDEPWQLAEQGALTLRVATELPASEAPEAHRILEAGGTRGRVVLRF